MKSSLKIFWIACSMVIAPQAFANTYTVTSTADSGPGTLRQAILDANANPGADVIEFMINSPGNLFEGIAPNTYAVIEVNTALPVITDAVYINGTTQTNTNSGSVASQSVGADNISLGTIAHPDVYIVPSASFVFPSNSTGVSGNGLSIDAAGVTIKGIAISGFGNISTTGASWHSDISVLRSASSRTMNIEISDCFISCDPLGNFPSVAQRMTKSNGILILGNNEKGTISNNYVAYCGTYGIHFNGNTDNLNVGPAATTVGNRNWTISGNRIKSITTNATLSAAIRVNDGINLMKCVAFRVTDNFIYDVEQTGIDLGYNSDSNYVANNTITGITRSTANAPQAAMRIGLCSEKDTFFRNVIYDNTGTIFKAGVWLDRSTLPQTGVVQKNNSDNLIQENEIYNNNGSGIVLSTNSSGGLYNTKITKNSIYDNTGLGIDLDFSGLSGPTLVTTNDDGDADSGPNNVQNFPIIDSVRIKSSTEIAVYGKAPAGSTVEFFVTDGQDNTHGGRLLNYGEGKTFIGSAVEGGAQDLLSGTAAYDIDGNVSSGDNLFYFILPYSGLTSNDFLTATATLGDNTSEFGPVVKVLQPLNVILQSFSAVYSDQVVHLKWKARADNDFDHFEVEHSTDGRQFLKQAIILPNVNENPDYEFMHTNVNAGKHFYRLRMLNLSGKIQYSSVLTVDIKNSVNERERVTLTSTNFATNINVRLNLSGKNRVRLYLFNQDGQLIKGEQLSGQKGMNYMQINGLSQLPAGTYILVAETSGETISQRLIKDR